MPTDAGHESTTDLLGDVVFGITRLVKGELNLARAEAQRSLHDAALALAKLGIAAVFGIVALNLLAAAAVAALVAAGWSVVWASLTVGLGLLVAAFAIIRATLPLLAAANLAPKRSLANLRQDAEILKSMVTPHARSDLRP